MLYSILFININGSLETNAKNQINLKFNYEFDDVSYITLFSRIVLPIAYQVCYFLKSLNNSQTSLTKKKPRFKLVKTHVGNAFDMHFAAQFYHLKRD